MDLGAEQKLNLRDALALAIGLYEDRAFAEAERLFRAVAEFNPNSFDAINGVGLCLAEDNGSYEEALTWFDRAFSLLRNEMVALTCNRARALGELARSEEALKLLDGLLIAFPDYIPARYNRGLIRLQLGRHHAAIADLDFVLEREPGNDKARFGRGFANLVLGNYEDGFRDYECRLKDDIDEPDVPLWTGKEDLGGKTILVHGEMGLGDNIMFMRYVPMLVAKGATIFLAVDDNVAPLAKGLPGTLVVGTDRASWPPFDYWVRFMSLALCFGTTQQTVPAPAPLHYDETLLDQWRGKLGNPIKGRSLKVGLFWSGNPKSRYDTHRSVPAAALLPLFGLPATFYSLQKDPRGRDLDAIEEMKRRGLVDIADGLTDFRQTAHAVANLDLMITCDTSVAHMAGTVGVPTLVMLTSYRTYWLWIEKQTHSPWYPSATLFRQKQDGYWDSVVFRIADKLRGLALEKAA